jgi:glycosyltransferase involved in cell wall biosynthesis
MEQLNNSAKTKLSIIIPVYNEERFINTVIKKVKSIKLPGDIAKEIIIINDASTDDTGKILKQYSSDSVIKIFHQEKNMGKSSAVRLGIERSTGDIILIQDADLEYAPDDYPQLIGPIIKNEASVVYGSRFKGTIEYMPLINRIANILSNITVNILFHTKITDIHTCYKVFKRDILKNIRITSKRFTFDTEVTVKILKLGCEIYEVPIRYAARTQKEGKKITWFQALEVYWGIIKY